MKIKLSQLFGDLKVTSQAEHRGGTIWWPCQYKCGNYSEVEEKRLLSGMITSCVQCDVKRKMKNVAE